ncbi:MAG: hypothetical protein KGO96_01765 [Elusimicrobia bacterium]|nr:hypothetical protein [Elusimicrobiota bacterium]MDE2237912.1 hypothetical protein [Elusimicrobiota bacterium]MDE2424622.1 hypothetical protein [Elusimicrobiota bacterium]
MAVFWALERRALAAAGRRGLASRLARRAYVLGHELTHALAGVAIGAKVLDVKVGESAGHVDLSHSNAFVALAPYCLPIYTLAVVAGYRILLWLRPGSGGRTVFLMLMGATLAFHLIKTFDAIWDSRQPDLPAAGGVVFSLSWILLANSLIVLLLAKALFPSAVELERCAALVAGWTAGFWRGLYALARPLGHDLAAWLGKR